VRLLFHADPHGDFAPLRADIERESPDAVILLGDYELDRPLGEVLDGVHAPVYWIHGNHDTHESGFDFLFDSPFPSLDGRVLDVGGCLVAGLGGVFKGSVWFPGRGEPRWRSREECIAESGRGNLWRGGLPRGKRDAIFPADWERLAARRADVLILHEAPECHPYGHRSLGDLARAMGVHTVLHGHHHYDYEARIDGGITVIGLGQAGSRLLVPTAGGCAT
jgi:predicted phosphodiesterase